MHRNGERRGGGRVVRAFGPPPPNVGKEWAASCATLVAGEGQNVQPRSDEQAGAGFATLGSQELTGTITLPCDFECRSVSSKNCDVIVAFPIGQRHVGKKDTNAPKYSRKR